MFGKNLSTSGIRTRDPVIRSWDRSEAKSEATLPLFSNLTRGSYGNRQNVPRIKTEQYSKYIFNTNPLAFFMKLKKKKKKTSLARFDPGTSRLLEMYFTTALFCKLKYSNEIKIYNESILIQGKTTHFLKKNSGVLKL